MKRNFVFFAAAAFLGLSTACLAQTAPLSDDPWNFLDTKTIGAYDFIKAHPTWDGRGVVIIICDSGVDSGVKGLEKTSDGKAKAIDARDFSGQGDIRLEKAKIDTAGDEKALMSGDLRLTGYAQLPYQPKNGSWWVGVIDEEKQFKNASVKDINNNGSERDRFGLLTFPVASDSGGKWVYFVDEDADGNIQDEKPRFNFSGSQETFTLRGRSEDKDKALLTFAVTILPEDKTASVHYCDNSHGTHCAGIAAGFQVHGESTQHGIAPGAQVISCKIGNGTLAGGCSTTGAIESAYDFGVQWAEDHKTPVVFSMSYGIGSEWEGHSDIEGYLNGIMQDHEKVLVAVSGGNEGPGLSSSGNPSCAERILSVAAMLPLGSARDSYGFANDGDRVFHFNSRGGEADKPDCAAPGAASSSVPMHAKGENMWGTSMACPQAAGAAAVLISACMQQDIPWNGALIKRALKQSARPIPGYTRLDQGTGVINIPAAFEILKMYASRREAEKILDYEIRTLSPHAKDQKGPALYWRTGTYFPAEYKKQTVTVKAIFPKDIKADDKAAFYRAFNLKAGQPWMTLDKSSTYIRGEGEAKIGIYFKHDLMKQPGLYTGVVSAFPKSGPGGNTAEFQIPVTVIVPHLPSDGNSYSLAVSGKTLKSGQNHRYFVQVPPVASAMHIEIAASSGQFSGIECHAFDPEGVEKGYIPALNPENREPGRLTISGRRLKPGIWEIIPLAFHNVAKPSTYDLSVRFDGLAAVPDTVTAWTYEDGEKPRGRITAVSRFGRFSGSAEGTVSGYRKTEKREFLTDKNQVPFHVDEGTKRVDFELSVSRETWGLFTDVAVNILDENDFILKDESMTNRSLDFSFYPKKPGKYTLEVWAGFALPENDGELWQMDITMIHFTDETIPVSLKFGDKEDFEIFPDVPVGLDFELEKAPRVPPHGCGIWGEIRFREGASGRTAAVTPVYIRY